MVQDFMWNFGNQGNSPQVLGSNVSNGNFNGEGSLGSFFNMSSVSDPVSWADGEHEGVGRVHDLWFDGS